jgi:hypothetical protein
MFKTTMTAWDQARLRPEGNDCMGPGKITNKEEYVESCEIQYESHGIAIGTVDDPAD